MFFEASTRTRISFGSAFNLLGGQVRETTGFESTAIAKGESLYDTARVLSGYSDVIAMRHPAEGSVAEFAAGSRVPVINGGDGANEHPTQALLDLFHHPQRAALAQPREIDDLRIAMVGDLRYGRTVHSLSRLLTLYKNVEIRLADLASGAHECPVSIVDELCGRAGHTVIETEQVLEAGNTPVSTLFTRRGSRKSGLRRRAEADVYRGRFRLNQAGIHRELRAQHGHNASATEGFP